MPLKTTLMSTYEDKVTWLPHDPDIRCYRVIDWQDQGIC
jgi:hypothetical protein